jgi:glycerol-3-phosphate O-acyltransferase
MNPQNTPKYINKLDYAHVIPDIRNWPIYKLSEQRDDFVNEVVKTTVENLEREHTNKLDDVIARTIYLERMRTRENPWKVDPPKEDAYWSRLRSKLVRTALDNDDPTTANTAASAITEEIVRRYANEIVGTFDVAAFKFARAFLTNFFNWLLNAAVKRRPTDIIDGRDTLTDSFKINGQIEDIRTLATKGTIIVIPTHFSNLDSILLGWAIDSLGLPALIYGAGLNLFNTGILAFFMSRLGAYKLDRRKKNTIYLETIKTYSMLAIKRGTHSLFFPGGTRARNGAIESKFKLGLLGTVTEAQRALYQEGSDRKIFIVPLVIGYNFVLEAQSLIGDYLKTTGEERYIAERSKFSYWQIIKFFWKLFSASSEVQLSFGKPLDVLGNFVDTDGNSYDKQGNRIEVKEYFMSEGRVTENPQRETQYTQILADTILTRLRCENIVLSSHLVTFVAFNILKAKNPTLDLYALLRLPPEDRMIPLPTFVRACDAVKQILFDLQGNDKIKLSEMVQQNTLSMIKKGISQLGIYHAERTLYFETDSLISTDDMNLLYYYHNRLTGYDLTRRVKWADLL